MGVASSNTSYGNKYGPNYAGGYVSKPGNMATAPRSRKLRSQYENFNDDNELEVFESANRDNNDKHLKLNSISVDGGGEAQPDNGSEKAILQTTTFTVRYD